MTEIEGGGPAFPLDPSFNVKNPIGLTKREWFAGMAMAGILFAGYKPDGELPPFTKPAGESTADCVARVAYTYADVMIKEGTKAEGKTNE